MFSELENGFGLDVVLWLQAHGNPLFDVLARTLHYLGGNAVYAALAGIVFLFANRELGTRLLLALVAAVAVANLFKDLFQTPRPYMVSERVVALVVQDGYGLPSGHTLGALIVLGALAQWVRRRAVWLAVVGYTLLIGWARMYAGVHYPQDVIAGLILGALALGLLARFAGPLLDWQDAAS